MTPAQIEDTKHILEFMGFVVKDFKKNKVRFNVPESVHEKYYEWHLVERCEYHLDYNFLMLVWSEFRDLKFKEVRHQHGHSTHKDFCSHAIAFKPIDEAFAQIAYACKWHNQTKQ